MEVQVYGNYSEFSGSSPAVGETAERDGEREGERAECVEEGEKRSHSRNSNGMRDF